MGKSILITSFTFPPQKNGVSRVVEAHALGLAQLGHNVTVATAFDQARIGNKWGAVDIRQFNTQGNGLLGFGNYRGDILGYQEYVSSFKGDLIICHCWQIWTTDLAVRVFKNMRCPKVLVSHGVSAKSIIHKSLKGYLLRLAWEAYLAKMPKMLYEFNHVIVLTERMNSAYFFDHTLMHKCGYKQHSVIPNGVHKELFSVAEKRTEEFRARYGIGKRPMILYVSNYDYRKNQKMAIEAFIKADIPEAVLVLIGSEINDYARSLESLTHKISQPGQEVIFLEKMATDETAAAFCSADLFICSSKWEVQPLVILESIAAGIPFVCTDVGCVRDIPGGIVVRNIAEMAKAIKDLMNDESTRRKLGQRGRIAVEKLYNWKSIIEQYDVLIERLCLANR